MVVTELGNVETAADRTDRQAALVLPNIHKGLGNLKPDVFKRPKVTMEEIEKVRRKMEADLNELNSRGNEAGAASDSAKIEFEGKVEKLKQTVETVERDLSEAMEMA